jgi:Tfp pilus assembly protein PilF
MLYQKLKDYRKAVKEFAKAAKADPTNPQVLLVLPCAVCLLHVV